jgi:hypothetical protein
MSRFQKFSNIVFPFEQTITPSPNLGSASFQQITSALFCKEKADLCERARASIALDQRRKAKVRLVEKN